MKFYKDIRKDNPRHFIEYLQYNGCSYYFVHNNKINSNVVESEFEDSLHWNDQKEIEYKDLPDIMKTMLKSIKFKTAMKTLGVE